MITQRTLVAIPVTAVLVGAAFGADYYLDHEYVRQEVLKQAFEEQDERALRRRKHALEDKRDLAGGLDALEKRELQRIEEELK